MSARARQTIWAVVGLLIGGLVAAVLTAVVTTGQIRATQVDRLPQNEKNDETLAIVKDCTQVGGRCYERGQQQTAEILASAQRIIVLAAACALEVTPAQSVAERQGVITACVTEQLAKPTAS